MRRREMPKVKVGDINMYYEVHGKGEPLVFIAGFTSSLEVWRPVIPIFSRDYQLVIFDNRGAGRSDAPDIPYTVEMMADDLASLLDAIGIKKAHIRGASMGGGIAQVFALRHPKRVVSLILECTLCAGPQAIPAAAEDTEALFKQSMMPPEESTLRKTALLGVTQEFAEKNPQIIKQLVEYMQQRPASTIGVMRQFQAARAYHGTYESLPEIKVPTLIVHGDADRLVPVENARILASRISNSELVIFKNTAHFMLEAGDELNRIILDFLRRHRT
jgi:pimeloyl-ACP methyl ester carboxylesterase